jgi:2-polyprenyl-3-methyl-5-hydroxy-6-metoxy-1,4-benzoquinol methylase
LVDIVHNAAQIGKEAYDLNNTAMTKHYAAKSSDYFGNARQDIRPLLSGVADTVLEVGCGSGGTLRWLKETGQCKKAYGIELFEDSAMLAKRYADAVVQGDAEQLIDTTFQDQTFDLILCLDVLEHMVDPWTFVRKLSRLLAPNGRIVFSIPNVRNLKVLLPLLFLGRWRYEERGILDRTHLRFFTRQTAMELATVDPQLRIEKWRYAMPPARSKAGILNLLTLGACRDFIGVQFLITSTWAPDGRTGPLTHQGDVP